MSKCEDSDEILPSTIQEKYCCDSIYFCHSDAVDTGSGIGALNTADENEFKKKLGIAAYALNGNPLVAMWVKETVQQ